MSAGLIRRAVRHRSSRRGPSANRPQPTTPIRITSVVLQGMEAWITFDQPVSLKGVPQYRCTPQDILPTGARVDAPNLVAVIYADIIAPSSTFTIPYEDPAIRNASGGFVSNSVVEA